MSIKRQIYYINSRNRLSGSDSDFLYKIEQPAGSEFNRVVVLNVSIPKSYYMIQSGQNTFTLDENGTEYTITLDIGNYTRSSFKSRLQTLLNATGAYTYTISIPSTANADTGKYTFNVTDNGGIQPKFIFTSYVFEQMGFNQNSTNTFSGDTLESTNVINLQLESTLLIHSDIASSGLDNVLQQVYSQDEATFSHIIFNDYDIEAYKKNITNRTNTYRFWLTNEDNNKMELNGLNWNMTLLLFKDDEINELIKKFIKLKTMKK